MAVEAIVTRSAAKRTAGVEATAGMSAAGMSKRHAEDNENVSK
jgi:hypothetical protein